jgi:hypothetical protein
MKKLSSVLAIAAFAGAAALPATANAWGGPWGGGGPWDTWSDAFGGGNMNFNASSYGSGRGYSRYSPWGYGYPGGWGGGPWGGYPGGWGGYPGGWGGGYPGYGAPMMVAPQAVER